MTQAPCIYDAVRTPRGRPGPKGSLKDVPPIELLEGLYTSILKRTGLDSKRLDDVLLGCVTQIGEQGTNIARISALYAGLCDSVAGITVNRFCTSGMDALQLGAMKVVAGSDEWVLAGGVESSSRVPMFSDDGAWFKDKRVAKKTGFVHMGISADLVATRANLSRSELEEYAQRSQERALAAWKRGAFQKSVLPVRDAHHIFLDHDELIRENSSLEKLGEMPLAFAQLGMDPIALSRYPEITTIEHVHHVGTSPALADGAALLLVGTEEGGQKEGIKPRAKILGMATAAVEPILMLTGNIPATEKSLAHAGLTMSEMHVVEVNESFAGVAVHYQRHFNIPDDKYNINGGAIAMGHALGATGAVLVNTALDALEETDGRYGLISICGGAGVASAMVIERLPQ
jgi:acetyl-CoA C-acetyltransferase